MGTFAIGIEIEATSAQYRQAAARTCYGSDKCKELVLESIQAIDAYRWPQSCHLWARCMRYCAKLSLSRPHLHPGMPRTPSTKGFCSHESAHMLEP